MAIELTILGCGSATPTLERNPSAQLLSLPGADIMIDCGEGTQLQLLKFKVKLTRIKAVFISHLHGDHYLGLPGFLSTMHLLGRKNSLTVFGPPELEELVRFQLRVSQTTLNYPLEFKATNPEKKELLLEIAGFTIYSFPLKHRIPCTGFLFVQNPLSRHLIPEQIEFHQIPVHTFKSIQQGSDYTKPDGTVIGNKQLTRDAHKTISYAYCSDTAPFPELIPHIKGVDWLYHEATFLHDLKNRAIDTFHSTALDAGNVALKAGVKNLIIGHYSSRYKEVQQLEFEASSVFANVSGAFDGMKITLT
jgi:ribonuclease Z